MADDDNVSNETLEQKQARVNSLRWQAEPTLLFQDHIFQFIFATVLFSGFLFVNSLREVQGPRDEFPEMYYIAVYAIWMLLLIGVLFVHSITMGNRKKRYRESINTALKDTTEITQDDPEYKQILEKDF
jgi:hypothetical protein